MVVTIGEVLKLAALIMTMIERCISAAKDKCELFEKLRHFESRIKVTSNVIHEYILEEDQQSEYQSFLQNCKRIVEQLVKILTPNKYSPAFWDQIQFALWTGKEARKEIKYLGEEVLALDGLNERIQKHATSRKRLEELRK